MPKMLTITVSDDAYESLKSAGADAHKSPEDLAAATITERFGKQPTVSTINQQARNAKEALLALMRSQGHLADPQSLPAYPGIVDLPQPGTPERAQFEEEVGNALSDALDQSGLSILDLIERR